MKVLDWILNLILSISSLWERSYDENLNEHRSYERRILVYTVAAVTLMIVAILITPSIEMQASDGIRYATYLVYKYIGVGALLLGAYSGIASFWNMAGLVSFRHEHGLQD